MEQSLRVMDQTELSLGPTSSLLGDQKTHSSSPELDHGNIKRKRKQIWDEPITRQSGFELQLSDPLSLDWEQYLDLQSGRMYYMNRKTLKKSWMRPPKEQEELDLNLNISSTFTASEEKSNPHNYPEQPSRSKQNNSYHAAVCSNCHLLVMLCKSSPSCPNCRYVHSPLPSSPPRKLEPATVKTSSKTLSLLH